MGVDTGLYLNPRWQLDDIKDILERTQGEKVAIESHHTISAGYFTFCVSDRHIQVFVNHPSPIGPTTYLSTRANEEGHRILRRIGDVLGGLFMPSDTDGHYELLEGGMSDEDGLPYFVKHAILVDGVAPHDLDAFLASKAKWHKQYG